MKKLKIFLLLILIMPIFVKADHGAPMVREYNARIKVDEAVAYDAYNNKTATFKYGTTFKVQYEEYVKFPGSDKYEVAAEVTYKSKEYYIKISDLEPVTNEIDYTKLPTCDSKYYVYTKGAYLYKGPSTIYGKLDGDIEIPEGTTLTCEYKDQSDTEGAWIYVTYNSNSGWLYYNDYCEGGYAGCPSVVRYLENPKEVTTIHKAKMYSDFELETAVSNIPKGSKIKLIGNMVFKYYVEYNGKKGFVSGELLYLDSELKEVSETLAEDAKLYDIDDFAEKNIDAWDENYCKNAKVLDTIPKGTTLKGKYLEANYDAYYVTYNNKTGIVLFDFCDDSESEPTESGSDVSEEPTTEEPATEEPTLDEPAKEEPITEPNEEVTGTEAETTRVPAPIKDRVIYYVIGAGVMAILASILILILNRKDNGTENPSETTEPGVNPGENVPTEEQTPIENNTSVETPTETPVENSNEAESEDQSEKEE